MKEPHETLRHINLMPSDDVPFIVFESEIEYMEAIEKLAGCSISQYTGASASVFRQA